MLEHYFKYRRVIARFRRGALGNEMDHIAADLSGAGYKRDSVKLYLARIVRFGTYAIGWGCGKLKPIPREIVERYLKTRPTLAARWRVRAAISHAMRCCPDRFAVTLSQDKPDPDDMLLAAYLEHLRVIRGLQPTTCEGLVLTARRMLAWQKVHLADKLTNCVALSQVVEVLATVHFRQRTRGKQKAGSVNILSHF